MLRRYTFLKVYNATMFMIALAKVNQHTIKVEASIADIVSIVISYSQTHTYYPVFLVGLAIML